MAGAVTTSAFAYVAASRDGRLHRGTLRAATAAEATSMLGALGLSAVEIDAAPVRARGRAAPRRELSILFRNLASLVTTGLPLEQALGASVPLTRGRLRGVVDRARDGLRQGASLRIGDVHQLLPALELHRQRVVAAGIVAVDVGDPAGGAPGQHQLVPVIDQPLGASPEPRIAERRESA